MSLSNMRYLISSLSVYVKSPCFEVHFRPLRWLAWMMCPKLCKGFFAVLLSDVSDLINGIGSIVSAMFNGLAKEECDGICSAFGTLLVDLADGVCNISPERNGDNLAVATSFPPILPKELAIMIPSSLVQVVIRFRSRLEKTFGEFYIDDLEKEDRSLRDRYLRDPLLNYMLESMKDTIGYNDAWVSPQSQFPRLFEFSSGLGTIYPGTTRVESNFSILGWKRDEYRSALMDFSLEGIMHSKQFKALQSIAYFTAAFCVSRALLTFLANDLNWSKQKSVVGSK
jgi:hypothetical protein